MLTVGAQPMVSGPIMQGIPWILVSLAGPAAALLVAVVVALLPFAWSGAASVLLALIAAAQLIPFGCTDGANAAREWRRIRGH